MFSMTKVKIQIIFQIFSAFAVRQEVLSLLLGSVSWLDWKPWCHH